MMLKMNLCRNVIIRYLGKLFSNVNEVTSGVEFPLKNSAARSRRDSTATLKNFPARLLPIFLKPRS